MLEQISAYLEAQGIGTADDICIGLMPDQPDDCIALFEYAGSPSRCTGTANTQGCRCGARQ